MKKSRRVKPITYDLCDIPFDYDRKKKIWIIQKLVADTYISYSMYRYLYFKLEILLGKILLISGQLLKIVNTTYL